MKRILGAISAALLMLAAIGPTVVEAGGKVFK